MQKIVLPIVYSVEVLVTMRDLLSSEPPLSPSPSKERGREIKKEASASLGLCL